MQSRDLVKSLAIGLLCAAGCANRNEGKGFAQYPKLKSQSGSASGARGSRPASELRPRILPETHYAAGRVFEQQGSPDKAIDQYRKAVALNHEYAAAYGRLGLMLSVTARHDEAVAAFSKAVELTPDSAVLHNNLGFELLYKERWAEAERHLREAARIDPRLSRAHINMGLLLGRTARYDEALESFHKALPAPDAYYNLGLILRAQREYAQAADAFRQVLVIHPEFTSAQRQLKFLESKIAAKPKAAGETQPPTVTATADPPKIVETAEIPATRPQPVVSLGNLIDELIPPVPNSTEDTTVNAVPMHTPADPSAAQAWNTPPPGPPPVEIPVVEIARPDPPKPQTFKAVEYVVEEPAAPPTAPQRTKPTAAAPDHAWEWPLTIGDIARALNIVDNERRCAAAEREAPTRPSAFAEPTQTPPDSLLTTTDEVVRVLPVSETRFERKKTHSPQAFSKDADTWNSTREMMRELEISLEIIRNEVDCRKTDNLESSDEPPFWRGESGPSAPAEPRVEITPPPASTPQPPPSYDPAHWAGSFGELDALLAIVQNEHSCATAYRQEDSDRAESAAQPRAMLYAAPVPLPYGPMFLSPIPMKTDREKAHAPR